MTDRSKESGSSATVLSFRVEAAGVRRVRTQLPSGGAPLTVLIRSPHRDRGVWGEDTEEWNPDHLNPQRVAALPPDAYKPFGTGQHGACIGRRTSHLPDWTDLAGAGPRTMRSADETRCRTRAGGVAGHPG